ncbi:hypothetical protein, partial [Vibrio crassostreae]|uniref:hypothetical protein n=1 Tax=Vibrio crassostreae TaxID=246167 RepID=UPI001A9FC965
FWSSKEVTHTVVTVKPMRVTPAELGVYQCLIKCSHIQRKTIHDLLSSLSQLNYNMVNSYRNHKFIHYMNHYTL